MITELCTKLRLSYSRNNWEQLIKEAQHLGQDHATFLENLLNIWDKTTLLFLKTC